MDNTNSTPKTAETQEAPAPFAGYTLNELKFQRALTAVRRQYAKEKTFRAINNIRKRSLFGNGNKGGKLKSATSLIQKAMIGFNYADYAMLGFSLFSTGKKIWNLFHRRK